MTREEVREIQQKLLRLGFADDLAVDGVFGPKTQRAYTQYLATRKDEDVRLISPPAAKPWWQSRTNIALLSMLIITVARFFGIDIEQAALTEILSSLAVAIAGIIGIITNAKRQAPIDNALIAPGLRVSRLRSKALSANAPEPKRNNFSD